MADHLSRFDIGQTVVIAEAACVAVEAMEGTDATILRAGEIMKSPSLGKEPSTLSRALTVVKVAKPNQDMRFDVPVVGLHTIETMKQAGATCLALDAGRCLLLDREALLSAANDANICVIAETPVSNSSPQCGGVSLSSRQEAADEVRNGLTEGSETIPSRPEGQLVMTEATGLRGAPKAAALQKMTDPTGRSESQDVHFAMRAFLSNSGFPGLTRLPGSQNVHVDCTTGWKTPHLSREGALQSTGKRMEFGLAL